MPAQLKIEEPWPADCLERVHECPYCSSEGRILAYPDVQDWSFHCAPGKWTYWGCRDCGTLYLDPRPTKRSIARAYAIYYTHGESNLGKIRATFKSLVRNQCYLAWYGINLHPRLMLPGFMLPLLSVFRRHLAAPSFILQELNRLPKGRLVDVGCGDGLFLDAARQLGWKTLGIEQDPEAARVVRAAGHEVILGTDEALGAFADEIDCVICSHVLEHVHDPGSLLRTIFRALKQGGVVLISLPNAGSIVLRTVGENWRGLEAPRHLAIPQRESLLRLTRTLGFATTASHVSKLETLEASLGIAQHRGADTPALRRKISGIRDDAGKVTAKESDFINVVLKKMAATGDGIAMGG